MSSFDFEIEHHTGRQHGNDDGLRICPNPRECTCPQVDNEEMLKCCPCVKCKKRAKDMVSAFCSEDSEHPVQAIRNQPDPSIILLSGYSVTSLKRL